MHPRFMLKGRGDRSGRGCHPGLRGRPEIELWGPGFGGDRPGRGGGGPRRGRVLDASDLKLLVLHLLHEQQPRHGYDIIKAIGELSGDGYSPSPGLVYPTLAYLEDAGCITAEDSTQARKRFVLTDEGRKQLAAQTEPLQRTLQRLKALQAHAQARPLPEIVRAVENLKTALRLRFGDGGSDIATVRQAADIIDRAASDIQRI